MLLEGLNILRFDNNGSNNTLESSPKEESNNSSDDFSANKPSTGEAQCVVPSSKV